MAWFDSSCPLCRAEVDLMLRLDRRRRIAFVDLNAGNAALCPKDRAAMLERFHVRAEGQTLTGAAAFAALWRAIPLLRPLGLAARSPLVLAGLERLYVAFLRVRPGLQRVARRIERRRARA